MFGREITVVGRTCEIHNSVNATSTASTDALFEVFSFQFKGNLTVEEICPSNGSLSSKTWNLTAGTHKLKLPLVCSLTSERINCNSIMLHSSVTEELHPAQYRMVIIEQHLEEEKINLNTTVFVRSNIGTTLISKPLNTPILERIKWPLIGTLSAIAGIILLGLICICLLKTKSNGGVNLTVTNTATSNNDNSSSVAPSYPSAFKILEKAPAEGLPPPYHSAVDIERLLAIPIGSRNASEIEAVMAHKKNESNSSPQI